MEETAGAPGLARRVLRAVHAMTAEAGAVLADRARFPAFAVEGLADRTARDFCSADAVALDTTRPRGAE